MRTRKYRTSQPNDRFILPCFFFFSALAFRLVVNALFQPWLLFLTNSYSPHGDRSSKQL